MLPTFPDWFIFVLLGAPGYWEKFLLWLAENKLTF